MRACVGTAKYSSRQPPHPPTHLPSPRAPVAPTPGTRVSRLPPPVPHPASVVERESGTARPHLPSALKNGKKLHRYSLGRMNARMIKPKKSSQRREGPRTSTDSSTSTRSTPYGGGRGSGLMPAPPALRLGPVLRPVSAPSSRVPCLHLNLEESL